MPLSLWKKGKNGKISQFVRDHIQSHRRRGGPLVVETGFPTSLVDLIVKNRQRLKKSSEIEISQNSSFALESSPPSALQPSPSPPTLLKHMVEETGETIVEVVQEDENSKGVLMALLRISLVVVLALGTKKLAVGLTMSAFFLMFVEYLGKRFCGLLIPCSDSKNGLRLMVVKSLRFMGIWEEKLEGKNAGFKEMKSGSSDSKNNSMSNSISEIQIMPSSSSSVASTEDVEFKEGIDESGCDRNLKLRKTDSLAAFLEEEDEYKCESMEIKEKKSRRAKMKSKLKHIFAKKSKREKKEEGFSESDSSLNEEGNAMVREANEEGGQGNDRKLECDSNLSSSSSANYEEKEAITMISDTDMASVEKVMDEVAIREMEEIPKRGDSGYLFLCVIVLIGLLGGRISALLLILSCCFMKKSGGKLRCSILPVIRHFCPNV